MLSELNPTFFVASFAAAVVIHCLVAVYRLAMANTPQTPSSVEPSEINEMERLEQLYGTPPPDSNKMQEAARCLNTIHQFSVLLFDHCWCHHRVLCVAYLLTPLLGSRPFVCIGVKFVIGPVEAILFHRMTLCSDSFF